MRVKPTHKAPLSAFILFTVLALVLSAAMAQAQRLNWKELDPEFVPAGRDDHMMAFDSNKGWIVLFGGDNAGAQTWIWDGETWRDLDIDEAPAPRRESAMVFDSWRKEIVMFGGYDYTIQNNVTWRLNLETEEWKGEIFETSPDGRADFAMAFHKGVGLTILYGGDGVDGATWAWDGEEWEQILEEDEGPGQRWGHNMVYDSKRGVIVMFGGVDADEVALANDTWEYDGEEWTEVTPEGTLPPAMRDFAMAYDSLRGVTVLFGGRDESAEGFDQTWEYDGESWTEVITPDAPSTRHEVAMAYDSWRNQMILFGGSSGDLPDNRFKADTWSYPNNPPAIEHTGPIGIVPGEDLSLTAEIVDYDGDQFEAYVYYRTTGETEYKSIEMELLQTFAAGNGYGVTIPGTDIAEPGLEYYFGATDPAGSGIYGYWQSMDEPWVVAVSDTGRLNVKIEFGPARKNGAQWQVVQEGVWYNHNDTVKLVPGEYEIRFSTVEGFTKPERMMVTIVAGQLSDLLGVYERK